MAIFHARRGPNSVAFALLLVFASAALFREAGAARDLFLDEHTREHGAFLGAGSIGTSSGSSAATNMTTVAWRELEEGEALRRRGSAVGLLEAKRRFMTQLGVPPKTFARSDFSSFSSGSLLKNAKSGIQACIMLEMDLHALGCAGCTVTLGLSAELASDTCTLCYRWRLDAVLGFNVGVSLLGVKLFVGAEVTGRIEPEEVPCLMARESEYCAVQDIFLEEDQLSDGMWKSRCHSSNPFTVVMSYIEVQLRHVRQALSDRIRSNKLENLSLEGPLANALRETEELQKYKDLFVTNPEAIVAASAILSPTTAEPRGYLLRLGVDCPGHDLAELSAVGVAQCKNACDRIAGCTLAVVGKQGGKYEGKCWVKGTHVIRTTAGNVPEGCKRSTSRDAHFIAAGSAAGEADYLPAGTPAVPGSPKRRPAAPAGGWLAIRAVRGWVDASNLPSPYLSVRVSRGGIEFESWESSYVLSDPTPIWDEMFSVSLDLSLGSSLDVALVLIDSANKKRRSHIGGVHLQLDLPLILTAVGAEGAPLDRCKLPCSRRLTLYKLGSDDDTLSTVRTGRIELEVHWLPWPEEVAELGLQDHAVTSLWAAYDSFSAKLPRYARQVMDQLLESPPDRGDEQEHRQPPEQALNGESLARWNPPDSETARGRESQQHRGQEARQHNRRESQTPKSEGFCSAVAQELGSRVVNVVQVIRRAEADASGGREGHEHLHLLNFYIESSMSVANLFLRTIGDIHAMFSVYFANDAAWSGECTSLPPSFQLLYEDSITTKVDALKALMPRTNGRRVVQRSPDAAAERSLSVRRQYPSKRVKGSNASVSERGNHLADDTNPWCTREWSSGSAVLSDQLAFATRDAPTRGRDAGQTPAGHHSGTVYAQLWCELAKQWRLLPRGRRGERRRSYLQREAGGSLTSGADQLQEAMDAWDDSSEEQGALLGRSLRFQALCRRLREQVAFNEDTHKEETHWSWEYREDCESVQLSAAFVTIFPRLFAQLRVHFARIGEHLEEVLLCGDQRIPPNARQFTPGRDDGGDSLRCTSVHPMNVRVRFARARLVATIHEVRAFLVRLGAPVASYSAQELKRLANVQEWERQLEGNSSAATAETINVVVSADGSTSRATTAAEDHEPGSNYDNFAGKGTIRYVVEQLALGEQRADSLDAFLKDLERSLQEPPWKLSSTELREVARVIGGSRDVVRFRAEKARAAVDKVLMLPFQSKSSLCESGAEESDAAWLMKCWGLKSLELEGAIAAAHEARLKARSLAWVRQCEHQVVSHWAREHGLLSKVTTFDARARKRRHGVQLSGTAIVQTMGVGNASKRDDTFGVAKLRRVRLVFDGGKSVPEFQHASMTDEFDDLLWMIDPTYCKSSWEACTRIPLTEVGFQRQDWVFDLDEGEGRIPHSLQGRAVLLHGNGLMLNFLPRPLAPPSGVELTIVEQAAASLLVTNVWLDDLGVLKEGEQTGRAAAAALAATRGGPSDMECAGRDVVQRGDETRSEKLRYAISQFALAKGLAEPLAALAAVHEKLTIVEAHFYSSKLYGQRPELMTELVPKINQFIASPRWHTNRGGVLRQLSAEELMKAAQHELYLTAGELDMGWMQAAGAQIGSVDNPHVHSVGRAVLDAMLQPWAESHGVQVGDTTSYVVFAGLALLHLEEAADAKLCCCKFEATPDDANFCNNPMARLSFWPEPGKHQDQLACCKRKSDKSCPTYGYKKLAPDTEMCVPPTVVPSLEGGERSLTGLERAVRLVATPGGSYWQYLLGPAPLQEALAWETSVEACDVMGSQVCRSVKVTCRYAFSVEQTNMKFQGWSHFPLQTLVLHSDAMVFRIAPVPDGHVFPHLHRIPKTIGGLGMQLLQAFSDTTRNVWLRLLQEYGSQLSGPDLKSGESCSEVPPRRSPALSEAQLKHASQGHQGAMAVAQELLTDLSHESLSGALALIARQLHWALVMVADVGDAVSQTSSEDTEAALPFGMIGDADGPCCSGTPNACSSNEELLPLRCTAAHMRTVDNRRSGGAVSASSDARDARDGRASVTAANHDGASTALDLDNPSWNLLAALDEDFRMAFAYFRPPIAVTVGADGQSAKGSGTRPPLLLTGLLWSALPEVRREFSEDASLEDRKLRLKRDLAFAMRQEAIASGTAVKLPYPPIRYASSISLALIGRVGTGTSWPSVSNACEPPQTFSFGVAHRTTGWSWSNAETSERCITTRGVISAVRLVVHIERCWHLVAGEEDSIAGAGQEPDLFDIWRVDVLGVLSDGDSILKTKARDASAFLKQKLADWSSISASSFQQIPSWLTIEPSGDAGGSSSNGLVGSLLRIGVVQLALELLQHPAGFLGAGAGSGVAAGVEVGKKLAQALMGPVVEKVQTWAVRWAEKAGLDRAGEAVAEAWSAGWQWVKQHVGVDSKQRQVVRAAMVLSRPSGGAGLLPWAKEFELHYMGFTTLEMRVTVPGIARVSAILAYVSDLNLSFLVNMVLRMVEGEQQESRFKQCLACFSCGRLACDESTPRPQKPHVFCADETAAMDAAISEAAQAKKQGKDVARVGDAVEETAVKWDDLCLPLAHAERCGSVSTKESKGRPAARRARLLERMEHCEAVLQTVA